MQDFLYLCLAVRFLDCALGSGLICTSVTTLERDKLSEVPKVSLLAVIEGVDGVFGSSSCLPVVITVADVLGIDLVYSHSYFVEIPTFFRTLRLLHDQ